MLYELSLSQYPYHCASTQLRLQHHLLDDRQSASPACDMQASRAVRVARLGYRLQLPTIHPTVPQQKRQGKREQDSLGQDRTAEGRRGQDATRQGRARQDRTEPERTGTGQDMGPTNQDKNLFKHSLWNN